MSSSAMAAGLHHLRCKLATLQRSNESDENLLYAFTTCRDDNAFSVLVRRHGPMVLGVCRRVLGHEQDAEDAFQATFLVLAQSADSLRNKASLASFLHGIAYRTALKAKQAAACRRKYERSLGALTQPRSSSNPADEFSWREAKMLLDEEIARLPEIYRVVFVHFHLQDHSHAETARRLGLKEATVAKRLAAARKRLAQRLTRRGVELTGVLTAMALATRTASALPAGLMATTIEAASAMAAGEGLLDVVSVQVAELVRSATASLMQTKTKIAAMVLLLAVTSGSLVGLFGRASEPLAATMEPPAAKSDDKPNAAPPPREAKTVPIQGRVVDPDGKPVRGAKIVFTYKKTQKIPHKIWAVSATDGRFAFALPVKELEKGDSEEPPRAIRIVAAADGYGFAVVDLGKPGTDLTLRLVKDDKPIRGRIIDLQGKPIAGVRIQLANNSLDMPLNGDLTDFLTALKDSKENNRWRYAVMEWLYSPAFDLLFPPVTTGADGRFEMKGIGRERMVKLRIEGPTIATQEVTAMTRTSDKIQVKLQVPVLSELPKGAMDTYYGADFELLAAPSRPIVGVVRDKDTGKPLAGVTIESKSIVKQFKVGFLHTTTDKDGRYRLEGMPKGDGNEIAARMADYIIRPGDEKLDRPPYLFAVKNVENPLGLEPVTVDFALKRGVWVKGRVTDKNTGKPLRARVEYFCFIDNPNIKEIGFVGLYNDSHSRSDGLFRIPVLPGHGLIAVRAYRDRDHYIKGVGADKIKGPRDQSPPGDFFTAPYYCHPGSFHTLVEIAPKAGEGSIACGVILAPAAP